MAPVQGEPLDPATAKVLIRAILERGKIRWSGHALKELGADKLTTVDAVNVLRGGQVRPGEWEKGSWRYPVMTSRICVIVAFDSDKELAVVTAWRISIR